MTVKAEIRDRLESLGSTAETLRDLGHQLTTGNGVTSFVGARMSMPRKYWGWAFLVEVAQEFGVGPEVAIDSGRLPSDFMLLIGRRKDVV